jgi:pimeloyl-ACP methyl ester carboxylesterase
MPGSLPRGRRPWYHPLRLAQRLVIYLAIGFVVICVFLYVMQSRMIYVGAMSKYTPEQAQREAALAGLMPWKPDGATYSKGWVTPEFRKPAPRGTVVILHGNGETAWMRSNEATDVQRRGFRAFLYEYPGYGGRPGLPSELTIVPDVRELVRSLDKAGYGPVYLLGQSLGSGVAAAACADATLPVHGLALVTPFDSLPNVGAAHYPFVPVSWLMIDRYNSIANLAHFKHPICVARSENDEIILPRLSIHLFEQLPEPKKMIVFKNCGHNDWPGDTPDTWWDEALDFIAPR